MVGGLDVQEGQLVRPLRRGVRVMPHRTAWHRFHQICGHIRLPHRPKIQGHHLLGARPCHKEFTNSIGFSGQRRKQPATRQTTFSACFR